MGCVIKNGVVIAGLLVVTTGVIVVITEGIIVSIMFYINGVDVAITSRLAVKVV